ncbi:hypothetical protein K493DRAFT_298233 [Basidiobolus meristosporus CBS 931.73]|uniref:Uncharacterized protein n=1 Tax=Basidiobolus meristosporus CBS 931.73 TaxID=1314790 RepID=A0A1Y1YUT5_9FUNG|nr:hypothetical protein K493DRAFT_298233 [Basidiobolus meristosporus CBS 931.73]|eukprot:ORY01790.1 hypothetical protein K493DRAFT_298233 [Basidiobolus meristosporus CBS 931.73]
MTEICNQERAIEDDSPNLSCQSSPETLSYDVVGSQMKQAAPDESNDSQYPSTIEGQSHDQNISLHPTSSMSSLNSENLSMGPRSDPERPKMLVFVFHNFYESFITPDQPNNSRVVLDQSVVVALLDHAYTDDKFNNYGYLGGKRVSTSRHSGEVICHISHFIPSIRSVESMLAGKGEESTIALKLAVEAFASMGVELLGWYRRLDATPTSLHPEPDADHIMSDATLYSAVPVIFGVNQQPYTSPESIRQIAGTLKVWKQMSFKIPGVLTIDTYMYMMQAILVESHVLFEAQRLDCGAMAGRKLFTDSEYDSFLMRFWKTSAIQYHSRASGLKLKKTVEQEFHSLALKKHHLKSLLTHKISHLQHQIELNYKNTTTGIRERKLAALEKLIDQTLTEKFESDSQAGSFNIGAWINAGTRAKDVPNEEYDTNFKRKSDVGTPKPKRQRKSGHSKYEPNRTIHYWPLGSPANGYARSLSQPQFTGKPNSSPHSQSDITPTQQPHRDFVSFSHPPTPKSAEVSPVRGYEQQLHNPNPNIVHTPDNSQIFLPPASQLPNTRIPSYGPSNTSPPAAHPNMGLAGSDSASVILPSIHGLFEMAATESATMGEPSNATLDNPISPIQNGSTLDRPMLPPNISSDHSSSAINEQSLSDTHEKSEVRNEPAAESPMNKETMAHQARPDEIHESPTQLATKLADSGTGLSADRIADTTLQEEHITDGAPSKCDSLSSTKPNQPLSESENQNNHT